MVHRSGRDPAPIFLPIEAQDMGKGSHETTYFSLDEGVGGNNNTAWGLGFTAPNGFGVEDDYSQPMMISGRIIGIQNKTNQNTLNVDLVFTLRKNLANTTHILTFNPAETGVKDTTSIPPIEFVKGDIFAMRIFSTGGTGSANILMACLVQYDGTPS